MINFQYDFTPEEWHQWNNQPRIKQWRHDIGYLQKKQMKEKGEVRIKEYSYDYMRTFIRKVNNAGTN